LQVRLLGGRTARQVLRYGRLVACQECLEARAARQVTARRPRRSG